MRVAGIARDEDPRQAGGYLLHRHVVELVAQTLADLVHRRPADIPELESVRMQDPVGDLGQLLRSDTPLVEVRPVADFVQLDVEPDQVSALPRDDQDVAPLGVDRALHADVREVGDRQGVHHTPRFVGRVADQLAADRGPDRAARAIAADHVPGADGRVLTGLAEPLHVPQGDGHRVLRRPGWVDLDAARLEAVEPA